MILPRKLGYFLFSMHTLVDRSRGTIHFIPRKKKLYIRRRQRINLVNRCIFHVRKIIIINTLIQITFFNIQAERDLISIHQ